MTAASSCTSGALTPVTPAALDARARTCAQIDGPVRTAIADAQMHTETSMFYAHCLDFRSFESVAGLRVSALRANQCLRAARQPHHHFLSPDVELHLVHTPRRRHAKNLLVQLAVVHANKSNHGRAPPAFDSRSPTEIFPKPREVRVSRQHAHQSFETPQHLQEAFASFREFGIALDRAALHLDDEVLVDLGVGQEHGAQFLICMEIRQGPDPALRVHMEGNTDQNSLKAWESLLSLAKTLRGKLRAKFQEALRPKPLPAATDKRRMLPWAR